MQKKLTPEHLSIPLVLAGFFIFAGGIGVALWFFTGGAAPPPDPGLAYQRKIGYNNHLTERFRLQDGLGWGADLTIDKMVDRPAELRLLLRDKNNAPVIGAGVVVHFIKPGQRMRSAIGSLSMAEPGIYKGEMLVPQPGAWDIYVTVQAGQNSFQSTQRVTLP